jgi:hypothetical protein
MTRAGYVIHAPGFMVRARGGPGRVALLPLAALVWCAAGCTSQPLPPQLRDLDGDGIIRVACLGDSNTTSGWPHPGRKRWCLIAGRELARRARSCGWPPVELFEVAVGGAGLTPPAARRNWSWARPQLQRARRMRADAIAAAFGTLDIGREHHAPKDVVRGYDTLARHARPLPTFVALIPPLLGTARVPDPHIAETNTLLRQHFAPGQLLDFSAGMDTRVLDPDGVHVSAAGQVQRAAVAIRTLEAALTAAYGPCHSSQTP